MDPSEDIADLWLKQRILLLMMFEERMLDVLTDTAVSARCAGRQIEAEEVEDLVRWHRVDLMKSRALFGEER